MSIVVVVAFGFCLGGLGIAIGERWRRLTLGPGQLVGLAAVSGVVASLAPGRPTAWAGLDTAMKFAIGAVGVLAAAHARRRMVLVAGLVVTAAFVVASVRGDGVSSAVTWAGVTAGLAAAQVTHHRRVPALAALTGGFLAQAALRLPPTLPARVPTGVAALALASIGGSAYLRLRPADRRRVRRGFLLVGATGLAFSAVSGIAVVRARADAEGGLRTARQALTEAQNGDTTRASADFAIAGRQLRNARATLRSWSASPGRAVPFVAHNLELVDDLLADAARLTDTAASTTGSVRFDRIRTAGGRVDVGALRALEVPLGDANRAVSEFSATLRQLEGPWIVPWIKHRLGSISGELDQTAAQAATAEQAARVVPEMLGASGPRRYLLVVPSPVEARGAGGLVGNWGEIVASDGKLTLARFGRVVELNQGGLPPRERILDGPSDYLRRYGPFRPAQNWQNLSLTPDFPAAASAMAQLYPQSGGRAVDGVISCDPIALAALLAITGPISVPGWPSPLSSDNATQVLLHDMYAATASNGTDIQRRIDTLDQFATAVWGRLTTIALPAPSVLGRVLGPPARERRLQMWTTRPEERAFLETLGATGSYPAVQGDFFGVVTNNAAANKIDWYLHRDVTYHARFDPATSTVDATATVTLRNTAPSTGESDYIIGNDISPDTPKGTSRLYVSFYSALALTGASLDGRPVALEADTELDRHVYSGWVTMAAGEKRTFTLHLGGPVASAARAYRLDVGWQPLVNPDHLRVTVELPVGWRTVPVGNAPGRQTSFDGDVTRDWHVTVVPASDVSNSR